MSQYDAPSSAGPARLTTTGTGRPRWRRAAAVAIAASTIAMLAAACSSSTGHSSDGAGGTGTTATAAPGSLNSVLMPARDPSYNGPDDQYFHLLDLPKVKAGQRFKVGYLQISGASGVLRAQQQAAEAVVKSLGGSMIVLDCKNNPQLQVSQLSELLNDGVDAIIGYPQVAKGLSAGFAQAAAKHIPVVITGAFPDSTQSPDTTLPTSVDFGWDYGSYVTMKALAAKVGKGAQFGVLALGLPVVALQYQQSRQVYWGKKFGLKYDGTISAVAPTPAAYADAAGNLLTRYPNVHAVVTYDDESAVTLTTAARQAGKTGIAITTSTGGSAIDKQAISSGSIPFIYRAPFEIIGEQMAIAVYDKLTAQGTVPAAIKVSGVLLTKANLATVPLN